MHATTVTLKVRLRDRDGLTTPKETEWIDGWIVDRLVNAALEMVLVGASNQEQVASANQILTRDLKTSFRIRTVDLAKSFRCRRRRVISSDLGP